MSGSAILKSRERQLIAVCQRLAGEGYREIVRDSATVAATQRGPRPAWAVSADAEET